MFPSIQYFKRIDCNCRNLTTHLILSTIKIHFTLVLFHVFFLPLHKQKNNNIIFGIIIRVLFAVYLLHLKKRRKFLTGFFNRRLTYTIQRTLFFLYFRILSFLFERFGHFGLAKNKKYENEIRKWFSKRKFAISTKT